MADTDPDLYKVENRETLRRLDNGMEITRATKHEPIDFDRLSRRELAEATDPSRIGGGSRFLKSWTLQELVRWQTEQIERLGWRHPPGVPLNPKVQILCDRPAGYFKGKLVSTVTIHAAGRYVHSYPSQD